MERSPSDNLIGLTLGNRFEIKSLIGMGGMANVYLAEDLSNHMRVAVKVLRSQFLTDQEFVRRFDAEAKAAASLNHLNIVKVYGVGEENGVRYMVMQYIEGMTLKQMIERYGPLDWKTALPIAIQISRALEEAHQHGIIHRDIKPHNIMMTPNHLALVTDFGIARAVSMNTITLAGGTAMGSVHYFSPEQARGSVVGVKADLYSLGILMYEMLTGTLPFDGETSVAVALMQLQAMAAHPTQVNPNIPRGLGDIIMKCIRKNPAERYEDASALTAELESFQMNPSGQYGLVDVQEVVPQASPVTVMPSSYADSNGFGKVRNLESSIYERRRKRRLESVLIIIIVLACIAVLVFFSSYVVDRFSQNIKVSEEAGYPLPNYVGQSIETIAKDLTARKIPFQQTNEESDKYPKGIIISQNLPEGTVIRPSMIKNLIFKVSIGSDRFKLPSIKGMTTQQAEALLTGKGLQVRILEETDDKVPKGDILRLDPVEGSSVRPEESVTIYVSAGSGIIKVPNLKGLTRSEADKLILSAKLKIGKVQTISPETAIENQIVISMSPPALTEVTANAEVSYILGSKDITLPEGFGEGGFHGNAQGQGNKP